MTRLLILAVAATVITTAAAGAQPTGHLVGRIEDAQTGEPVGFAQMLLEEANRSAGADADGDFQILHVAADTYTLKAFRIGYEPLIRSVVVPPGDTVRVVLRMAPTLFEAGEIVVEAGQDETEAFADAALELEGRVLRQHLGTTIAETLNDQPGIAMRSMGPAPARPVLRGLGGVRLLMLEDGGRTGDLSATSTDHAVVIDPLASERIEVIRGPAALVYGSNTLGGVVNVVRGRIPTGTRRAPTGVASVQMHSVNSGFSGGFRVQSGVGPFAVHLDGSARKAGDVSTPVGPLHNTGLETLNGAAGAGYSGSWGRVGLAGSVYDSQYGIPGGFVGAHPHGVDIALNRRYGELKADLYEPLGVVPRLELDASISRYEHQEYEADDVLGVEFGLITYSGRALVHTHRNGHTRQGAVGIWTEYRDYASGGFSSTPASTEWTLAGFGYQDFHLQSVTIQAGLRYDIRRVAPREHAELDRTFGGYSASIRGMLHVDSQLSVGTTLMRSLRMPGIEELYSDGPHLAAYSFEIGNADLDPERGWGVELFTRYASPRASASFAVFRNMIQEYIFPRNTGEIDVRTLLPIYQQSGSEAVLLGGEGSVRLQATRRLELSATASYVRGTLTDRDEPLPWIPPLRGRVEADYSIGSLKVGLSSSLAGRQSRTGPFEMPTDGYAVLGAHIQYHLTAGRLLHTIDLGIENLTDSEYRDHLSRVKSVMPEPGRNLKLLYRVHF